MKKNTTPVRTNNHGYVPLVVSIIPSFPLLWLITWFLFRIIRRLQVVKQDLHIIPEYSSSPTLVSGYGFALNFYFLCSILTSMVCLFALFLFAIISLFDLWLLSTTLAYSNALFMYDVMQIYTPLFSTKTKYGINKTCTINLY
jgi:hypothetical protein